MMNTLCAVYVIMSLGFSASVNAFNIDIHVPIIKQGLDNPNAGNSYFGYSVSPHKIIDKHAYRVLVGAPLDNMTNYLAGQHPSGALYGCPITMARRDCEQILMLKPPHSRLYKHIHKNQWLGVNVQSDTVYGGSGHFAYTCGHRFMVMDSWRVSVPGICMAIPNGLHSSGLHRLLVLSPPVGRPPDRSAGPQAPFRLRGTAFASRPDLGVLAIGAANERSGVGDNHFAAFPGAAGGGGGLGGSQSADLSFVSTADSARAAVQSANAGYAVSLGRILKGRRFNFTLVSGSPTLPVTGRRLSTTQLRSAVAGQVALFGVASRDRAPGQPPSVLPGESFGSRFGHSLLALDLNGDGWDDLLVGAPNFEDDRSAGEVPRLVRGSGAVYLFLNKVTDAQGQRKLQLERKLRPRQMARDACALTSCADANFGAALSAVGDLNMDGLPDVAIGAPGEGNGAVYVFHGHRVLGLTREPTQVILASQLSKKLRGFGSAVSGGLDLDGNSYPDIVIGAPFSGHAVILRTRPVLQVVSSVIFVPEELDPSLQPSSSGLYECPPSGRCLDAKIYLTYRHANAAAVEKQLSYKATFAGEAELLLDEAKSAADARVVFRSSWKRSYRQKVKFRHVKIAGKEPVLSLRLYINPKAFMDKMTPISLRLSWSLNLQSPTPQKEGAVELPDMNKFPVFNSAMANHTFQLPWKPTCASKGVCISDLNFDLKTDLERSQGEFAFLLGGDNNFWLNFTITNINEEAHMTFLNLDFNYRLALLRTDCPFACDFRDGLLRCPIANPLREKDSAVCRIQLSGCDIAPDTPSLNFSAWLSTVSRNVNSGTTRMNISASVRILASIQLKSLVSPGMIVYKDQPVIGAASVTQESKIGPLVSFTLLLRNKAPNVVPASNLTILWPYELAGDPTEAHGKYLLYLLRPPSLETAVKGSLRCENAALTDIINANRVRLQSPPQDSRRYFAGQPVPDLQTTPRSDRRSEVCMDGLARCRRIRCQLGQLSRQTGTIRVRFEARLWLHTLVEMFPLERSVPIVVNVSWLAYSRYSVQQTHNNGTSIAMTLTAASACPTALLPPNNLWLFLILAIATGLLLFGLVVLLLRKLNFFRRDKRVLEQRLAELEERREEEKHKYEYMEYD